MNHNTIEVATDDYDRFVNAARPRRPPKVLHLWPPKLLHLAAVI
ncbi:MAG TPA: hypothetical protein PLJ81_11620 [Giesbergeria sp.]|nr:hypothetical protein [Giesbergeria sp.]